MDTPSIVFLIIFGLLVVATLSQTTDRSGKRIGKGIGRLIAYGIAYLGIPLIAGVIPYLILSTIGFEGATAKGLAVAFGVIGMLFSYAYVGEWIERRERARERKVEQISDGNAEKPPGVERSS